MAGRSSSYADRISRDYEQRFGPVHASDPNYAAYVKTALPQMVQADRDALARSQGRWKLADKFAFGAAAIPFAAAAAPVLFGGGTAASLPAAATEGVGFSSAGGSGMGFSLGKLLGSRGFEAIGNGLTSILGLRSQNNANRYATDVNARLTADQIRLEQERIARQEAADAADRADAQKRWDAEQALRAKEVAATEEERAYNRSRRELYDPYRQSALRSLGAILGIR